ncbi:MAG: 16S rRNA (cytosine(1402)-N(4))-methyltransferase RsmH [Parcubacteria group bacterium]|nr:16S rRNA (cytosine(1402)-N(4))-methyltransferase RsmH [Parcubacteria group bacterium]
MAHTPVLLHESLEGLALEEGDIVLDATVGNGGHSKEICAGIGEAGTLIGLDLDEKALQEAAKNLAHSKAKVFLRKSNFRNLDSVLRDLSIDTLDKALFDLGTRLEEITESGRGFSFMKDEPLLMTYDANPAHEELTAAVIVNTYGEEEIARILFEYGDERFAKRIARGIVERRREKHILGTQELVSIIEKSMPGSFRRGKIHPATKTFQALRIAVNDEFGALEEGLEKASAVLAPGGRIAVISFHSGEDRIVKQLFRELSGEGYQLITKKPIQGGDEEVRRNPRARSAKLRIIQKNNV